MKRSLLLGLIASFFCLFTTTTIEAQRKNKKTSSSSTFDQKLYESIQWRNIGPFRGGRSAAVTGVAGKPNLFYFGAAGGGVWRTKDGGSNWKNISDNFFGGSVGAIAVSQSDNNTIYVGGGEITVRGNVSHGYGIWKSIDAGKTWQQMGLKQSRHIPRIRIHPKNPDIVYAAVLGDLYKSSSERGVYRSMDGGQSWKKVLYINADAGACDLLLDPNNPRHIYATTWRIKRTPYSLESGGEGSSIWKSTDGGDNWDDLSKNKGFPKGPLGISGIAVSPVDSDRVWAIIEAKDGGVFRSSDAGKTWSKINSERKLRQRAWYYSRIYADPQDVDGVYILNVRFFKSKDGGKSFKSYATPHSDHHDLWIDPDVPERMIVGDDGGAQISYDGAENWSTYYNQATAQFYRVTTDDSFPYRIYAAQQDNSTVRIRHRTTGGSIGERDWEPTAGCECGHIAIDPVDNDIVYGGCYDGFIGRQDHKTDANRIISVWPDNPMGHGAEGMRYRFQWNFPLFFSPHNKKKLYTASNHLHVSTNGGQSWDIISPDLTRNDSTKLVSSGGPITKDNTSVEYYCTIFAAVESPLEEGLIWAGSDDGLVHITRDGGKNWTNVTPKNMPEWMMINSIEVDPHQKGSAYIAGTKYKTGDFQPYLYKTKNYGKTWTKITRGIPSEHFTRVVRVDPKRKGLLYAGTETGMYISFDDGSNWQAFQLNLPIVPITDLTIKEDNLIAATQGRSIWMIDDLTPLHQLDLAKARKNSLLYQPKDAYKMDGRQGRAKNAGQNHPGGVTVHYYVKTGLDTTDIKLEFLEQSGKVIKAFSAKEKKEKGKMLKVKPGANTFNWNMAYEGAKGFEGMILWWASLNGPTALPGKYSVRLTVNGDVQEADFNILKDPRSDATPADMQAQFDFRMDILEKVGETHKAIKDIRDVRAQMDAYTKRIKENESMKDVVDLAKAINKKMTQVEETLYQTKNRSAQDPLNFPIRLNNKLAHLNSVSSVGNYRPTDQAVAVQQELTAAIDVELMKLKKIIAEDLPQFNELIRKKKIDAIILKKSEKAKPKP